MSRVFRLSRDFLLQDEALEEESRDLKQTVSTTIDESKMSTSFSELPSRMAPYITMTALDQPVPVAQGPFRLIGTGEGTLEANLSFCWLPTPRFQFEGLYSGTCAFYLFIRQPMGRKSALRREIPWILRGFQGRLSC